MSDETSYEQTALNEPEPDTKPKSKKGTKDVEEPVEDITAGYPDGEYPDEGITGYLVEEPAPE